MENKNQFNQAEYDQFMQENGMQSQTVVNGKTVSVEQAQAAMQAHESNMTETGIQAHHANTSEAVQAGQKAKNASKMNMQNVQSGEAHLEQHMNQGQATMQADQAAAQMKNAKAKNQADQ